MATIAGTDGAGALIGASAGVIIVAGEGTDTDNGGDAPAFYAFKPLTTVESGHVDGWVAASVDGIGFNIHAGKGNDTISPDDVPAVARMGAPDIPGFTRGTLILCPEGERRVEDLRVGDIVRTCDNGDRAIRRIGRCGLTLFPERRDGEVPASARPLIPGRKARRLVERHARHGRPLLDGRI